MGKTQLCFPDFSPVRRNLIDVRLPFITFNIRINIIINIINITVSKRNVAVSIRVLPVDCPVSCKAVRTLAEAGTEP